MLKINLLRVLNGGYAVYRLTATPEKTKLLLLGAPASVALSSSHALNFLTLAEVEEEDDAFFF